MSDLISRQAAKNKKVYSKERHEYVIPVADIDWLPSVQQWTPISDGLPEKESEVFVTTSWNDVCIAWCDINGKWRGEFITEYEDDEIIAWMLLPEPYKRKNSEEG